MRSVSVLGVADPALWSELAALGLTPEHVAQELDPHRRIVTPTFERELLPALGDKVLLRYARRPSQQIEASRDDLSRRIAELRAAVRDLLHAAQRHALDEVVMGIHAWDPEHDARKVRELVGAGLLMPERADAPIIGRYRLNPDLPPPPSVDYDFAEAVMDETDDLSEPEAGPVELLHDLAALAAAIDHTGAKRTYKGTVAKADSKRIGKWLGSAEVAQGNLESSPRWGKALRAIEALGAVSVDPIERTMHLDVGLEATLEGSDADAVDRFVHRLMDRDLHVVLPAVRSALAQAGPGAIDEMIFLELLGEQHRDVLFPAWSRRGQAVYPSAEGETERPFDAEGWERVECRLIGRALDRCATLGLIRRADGVFAGTEDGRRWAGAHDGPRPPVWVTSDLEVVVPPYAITPWERFQLERLGRCLARDTVDRYRLNRDGLVTWLRAHDVDEALELLARRCPGVPATVSETLVEWARSAQRFVLTRGVLVD